MNQEKNISQVPHNKCTGCFACFNTCPTLAIEMKEDKEGFLFPIINNNSCINCGKCYKICPAIQYNFKNCEPKDCYAIMGNNELRKESSSGGVFTILATKFLKENGVVCGVKFTDDYRLVYHTFAENIEELNAFRGSKYIQSDIGMSFQRIKKYLILGKKVLFTGTPCQVAGLYNYLGRDYENLLTCDVMCHGISNSKFYQAVFDKLYGFNNINSVSFRTKFRGHDCTNGCVFLKNGSKKIFDRKNNIFEETFHSSKSLRLSCYDCKFAQNQRVGDITLGDWWGFYDNYEIKSDKLGVSLVLFNSPKSLEFKDYIKENSIFFMPTDFEIARRYNSFKGNHYNVEERNYYMNNYFNNPSTSLKYDVGIIGFWDGANYGSVLTYFALNTIIKELGYTTIMLRRPVLDKNNVYMNPITYNFVLKKYLISKNYHFNEMAAYNNLCDTFILGADQVFAHGCIKGSESFFLLDFALDDKKKIAYASSFGHKNILFATNEREMLKYRLSRFDYLSTREFDGIDNCKELGCDAVFNLDPCFLCDKKYYDDLALDANLCIEDKYILAYILDPSESIRESLLYAEQVLGMKVKVILDAQANFSQNKNKINLDDRIVIINKIEDWFYAFANASFVITDSFHGTCMAIINNKTFITIANPIRGTSRTDTLKKLFNINDRIIDDPKKIMDNVELFKTLDFNNINSIISQEKRKSLLWLKNALSSKQTHIDLISKLPYNSLKNN